ncbi:hypothetical protein SDJN03_25542, partial [Cucurbita argyrosperma subsp. sororia]
MQRVNVSNSSNEKGSKRKLSEILREKMVCLKTESETSIRRKSDREAAVLATVTDESTARFIHRRRPGNSPPWTAEEKRKTEGSRVEIDS